MTPVRRRRRRPFHTRNSYPVRIRHRVGTGVGVMRSRETGAERVRVRLVLALGLGLDSVRRRSSRRHHRYRLPALLSSSVPISVSFASRNVLAPHRRTRLATRTCLTILFRMPPSSTSTSTSTSSSSGGSNSVTTSSNRARTPLRASRHIRLCPPTNAYRSGLHSKFMFAHLRRWHERRAGRREGRGRVEEVDGEGQWVRTFINAVCWKENKRG
jgi:hypothetical protein